jgi:UDP:flavonoid glycosyltransferase YjiC (YdhE family)
MARILYGVHGTGHGHAIRALTIARHFAQHEFLFISHGTGAAILGAEFPVEDCPNPETPIKAHRVEGSGAGSFRSWTAFNPRLP